MDDKLLISNYLLDLKSTVEVYVHGTLESSNKKVRELLNNNLNTILNSQYNTYNKMTEYGWYSINNVDNNVISNTLEKIQEK